MADREQNPDPTPATPAELERLQRERAEATIRAVSAGANPAEEAFKLSNQYTDEWVGRTAAKLRRLFRRP
jgi:hypothetical protein